MCVSVIIIPITGVTELYPLAAASWSEPIEIIEMGLGLKERNEGQQDPAWGSYELSI